MLGTRFLSPFAAGFPCNMSCCSWRAETIGVLARSKHHVGVVWVGNRAKIAITAIAFPVQPVVVVLGQG